MTHIAATFITQQGVTAKKSTRDKMNHKNAQLIQN